MVRTEARSAARLAHPNVAGVHDFGTLDARRARSAVHRDGAGRGADAGRAPGGRPARLADRGADLRRGGGRAGRRARRAGGAPRHQAGATSCSPRPGRRCSTSASRPRSGSADADPDGPVLGTPAYVAPERFDGEPATAATDMCALGHAALPVPVRPAAVAGRLADRAGARHLRTVTRTRCRDVRGPAARGGRPVLALPAPRNRPSGRPRWWRRCCWPRRWTPGSTYRSATSTRSRCVPPSRTGPTGPPPTRRGGPAGRRRGITRRRPAPPLKRRPEPTPSGS